LERVEFEKLALEHLDAVYRMAFHLSRRQEEAEDLVQEVYVRAMRPGVIERFEESAGSGGMRSWLFAICHNVFYTRAKRASRQPVAVEDFYSASGTESVPGEAVAAWDRASLDWEQVDGRLRSVIDGLKEEYREVLLMWGVDGLKYREIATILEVPIGTVMSRLHRARKLVAEGLVSDEGAMRDLGLAERLGERAGTADDGMDDV
jgi:RNA polymerase sigma-70 factor (ECF subfamily)